MIVSYHHCKLAHHVLRTWTVGRFVQPYVLISSYNRVLRLSVDINPYCGANRPLDSLLSRCAAPFYVLPGPRPNRDASEEISLDFTRLYGAASRNNAGCSPCTSRKAAEGVSELPHNHFWVGYIFLWTRICNFTVCQMMPCSVIQLSG